MRKKNYLESDIKVGTKLYYNILSPEWSYEVTQVNPDNTFNFKHRYDGDSYDGFDLFKLNAHFKCINIEFTTWKQRYTK